MGGQGGAHGAGVSPGASFFTARSSSCWWSSYFPFFWMAFNSFKTHEKILEYPPAFVFSPTLDNFRNVLWQTPVLKFTWNSVLVAFGSVAVGMAPRPCPPPTGSRATATGRWPWASWSAG